MYHSKVVTSNQNGVHEQLQRVVLRHINSDYRKPYQAHNLRAFELLQLRLAQSNYDALMMDSCCGTAMSSITLAQNNPGALIVGIDQSYHRLNKQGVENDTPENCLLLRANCEDIWRLCIENHIYFDKHFILYPNPWPKMVHLQRRWHGHSVFPYLDRLAKNHTLKSNWKIYLEEFAIAWELLTQNRFKVDAIDIGEPLTLFEKKYSQSNQTIYQLVVS
ncbi:SAM-dependent methyltransferase [Aliikangiella coralliicola]|uniref:tRNA (guanine(46)-N(7))-methyltransferase n=1 Tax=Aliikangiella coralliicola TaxID=2592383 RepID=A0A545U7F8_9GAMM|nr:SAM-dependent methyltransferase [Aliikangiella coralliicola]TQV85402.1 SAM-dependent methyltransferase [Aliikangiella coralliicola]